MTNYLRILQLISQRHNTEEPTFVEKETNGPNAVKKFVCEFICWTTEGVGNNEEQAKQNAARLMLENPLGNVCSRIKSVSVGTKVSVFADKNRKGKPLYSDKEREDGLFVVEYKYDGYTAKGKGRSKKIAKKIALEKIAAKFDMHRFYDNHLKKKERMLEMKFWGQQVSQP